ncbi:putative F-box/LRR-repeat protein C02F5.7-like protein [Leptotrombidium deliense]|uniref:Putative F-box/LRR-repeat protein C02F5.7-like protein n=1 Tax=Leptotrombidium deliense TaxID=299467 RepID=A0A443SDN4_9ACAR|nr:putative F-box/LRR-repeat protein C02F5.7-like protein [Leptotrombidium deliense]
MEVDENSGNESGHRSRRKSPHASTRKGIVLNKPLSARIGEMSQPQGYAPSKMMLSTRRSSSGIFITTMFGARFRHLQKLHSDAFTLGLNSVCFPGLPVGTMFRSSLPATPVSTPIHREFHHFTEQAIRERLCRTPSPRKNRVFGPLSLTNDDRTQHVASDGLNSLNRSNCSTTDGCQPMEIMTPTTPIAENIPEEPMSEASNDKPPLDGRGDEKQTASSRKLFVGNISYRSIFEKRQENEEQLTTREEVVKSMLENKNVDVDRSVVLVTNTKNINDLSDDLLMFLFSKIKDITDRTHCERVCTRWRQLVLKSWLVEEELDFMSTFFYFGAPALTTTALVSILKKCPNLKRLNLEDVTSSLDTKACELIAAGCGKLESLNLTKADITNFGLRKLGESCSLLKSVNINNCTNFSEKGLWYLLNGTPNLEDLEIKNNAKITGACFRKLKNIRILNILNCSSIIEKGFQELSRNGKNLEMLKTGPVSGNIVQIICSSFNMLKHLEICSSVLDEISGFVHFEKLTNLEVLKVVPIFTDCTDGNFVALLKACKNLRILEITHANQLTDASVKMISTYCVNICELSLSYSKIGDESVNTFNFLGNLRSLEIDSSLATDVSLKNLIEFSEKLNFLNLNNCDHVSTDLMVFAFLFVQENRSREQLAIQYCNRRFVPRTFRSPKEVEDAFDMDEDDPLSTVYEDFQEENYNANNTEDDEQDFLSAEDPVAEFERNWIS